MSQAIKNTLKFRSPSVYAAGLFALLAMTALPATAQVIQREPPPAGSDGGMTGKQLTPEDKGAGTPRAQDDKSSAEVPNTKAKQLSRVPQTADEKAKLLSDLYAHLQTAEDEAAAKKLTEAIERLWQFSGSDTVNLLMQRSTKAIKEKKNALALKLLDRLAELAPDYPEVFNQRAYYHFTQNNYEAAAGDLRRVLAMDPNHYKALEGLAQIWRETGNKKGAYKVMQQLLEVHPFSAGAKQIHDELKKEVDGQGI